MRAIHGLISSTALAIVGLASAPCFAQAAAQSSDGPQAGDEVAGFGEIIVTANRREERGQDVPVAITSFSGDDIKQQGISNGQDLMGKVASLNVSPVGQGSRGVEGFTLRGVPPSFQGASSTVVYLAEVPLPQGFATSQQGGPGNYVDLENIQVLSGPQGTLFGRNTTGGAVLLVPHKPTNELEGYLEASTGNYDYLGLEGVLNVPLIDDKLMVRVSGTFQDRNGFTQDVLWNTDRDNLHYYAGRIGILFRPSDGFENYLMAYGSSSETHGSGHVHLGFNVAALPAFGACGGAFTCNVYSEQTAIAQALGPRKTRHGVNSFEETGTWGVVNTSTITLSDRLTLRNIISYQRYRMDYVYDSDATPLQHLDSGSRPLPTFPVPGLCDTRGIVCNGYANQAPGGPRDKLEFFTEELQLQGNALDGKLNYTLGGYYYDQDPIGQQLNRGVSNCRWNSTGNLVDPDGSGPLRACPYRDRIYGVSNLSKALYGQATLDFGAFSPALDSLRLTAGYRYTWDTVDGSAQTLAYTFNPANPSQITNIRCGNDNRNTLNPADCLYTATLKSKTPTWTFGLDYKPIPGLMIYGKVSRGFKTGGFNNAAVRTEQETFGAEKVTAYEAGFKSDWNLGTVPVRWNLSAYLTDYPSYQATIGDRDTISGASGAARLPASAEIKGIETDIIFRPVRGIELGGNLAYTDAKWTEFKYKVLDGTQIGCNGVAVGVGNVVDITCANFPSTKWVYNLYASIDLPVPESLGKINLFAKYTHFSARDTTITDVLKTEVGGTIPAYGLLNLSVNWRGIGGSPVDATFFMNNATNKLYSIGSAGLWNGFAVASALYGEPRMYGVRMRYSFGTGK